jgi:hypothetical protein
MRQGCGISPLLFAIGIEPLINSVGQSLIFKGVPLPNKWQKEVRIAAFADDTTAFATSAESVVEIIRLFEIYSKVSGALLNKEKSIALTLSGKIDKTKWRGWLKEVEDAKICGIYFGKNAQKLNKEKLLEKLKKKAYVIFSRINSKWSRVKTINLLILAKLWHLATVQEVNDVLLNDIERTIFKLIWTKIERVKRSTLTLPIEEGGLGVII